VKVSGESASADVKAAEEYLEALDKLIVEENYLPEQIFNMDETTLLWKQMPERTFQPYDCIKNLAWAWGVVTKEGMTGIWKKTLKRFVHDFKGFAKDEKVAKISKAVVETASNFNLGVDEDDIEEFLEAVPEELTNEELLELKQECIAQEEAREKETAGEEKEEPQRKFKVKGLAEAFANLNKVLKKSENMDPPTPKGFH